MLVLTRKEDESVILGDEVTVTVEEICDSDDRVIVGARVRLGFQMPNSVAIKRAELVAKRSDFRCTNKSAAKPTPPPRGRLVDILDAAVRLRIQLPRKVPVLCNGTPTVDSSASGASNAATASHCVTCRKGDRITICGNITLVAAGFKRFVLYENQSVAVGR